MKSIHIFFLLLILKLSSCNSPEKTNSTDSIAAASEEHLSVSTPQNKIVISAWLEGKIKDKYLIWMYLDGQNGKIKGKYRYLPKKEFLQLEGSINPDHTITLIEYNDKGEETGMITGTINTNHGTQSFLTGKWKNAGQTKTFSIELNPVWMSLSTDTVYTAGKYSFSVKRVNKVTSYLAPIRDLPPMDDSGESVVDDFKDIMEDIEKNGCLQCRNLNSTDIYYEKIGDDFHDKSVQALLNKALMGNIKEMPMGYSIPEKLIIKKDDNSSPGIVIASSCIDYINNNIITIGSGFYDYSYGAAHPTDGYGAVSYHLDNGNIFQFRELFDASKISQLNDLISKNSPEGCNDSYVTDDDQSDCSKIPENGITGHSFGISCKVVKIKLECPLSEAARACYNVEIPKESLKGILNKGIE
jgi:hypothetical protein